jgi:1-acyl-sn-glycerol-3-phosphate acyltransferase
VKPARVKLTVSAPIYEEQYKEMELKDLAKYTQDIIASKM